MEPKAGAGLQLYLQQEDVASIKRNSQQDRDRKFPSRAKNMGRPGRCWPPEAALCIGGAPAPSPDFNHNDVYHALSHRGLTASTEGWAWPETLSPDPEGTGRSVLLQASGSWQDTWGFPPSAKTPRTDMVITQDQRDTHWLPIFLITTI